MNSILIFNWRCPSNPLSGGAERVTLEHAKAWVKAGFKVTWLAGGYKNCKNVETFEGVTVFRVGSPLSIYFLAPFLYWFKWGGKFDLVFDEIHGLPFLSPLWAWKSKKLAYIHEVAQEIWDEMLPFPINVLGKIYEKIYIIFYKNTPFLTVSNSTKTDLIHYGIEGKNITVIPNGLFIKPVAAVPVKEKALTLLYVSRLVKMKGIEDTIRIFAEVIKKAPSAKLWIVGSGEKSYVQKLRDLVLQLGLNSSVIFFGYVDEAKKIELYQKAHFLLHTSVREGFGLVVIEANSQGTPAITYDSPGLRDVVQNGVNGYTFPRGSYRAPAEKITSLFSSSQYSTLVTSSILATKEYNWSQITEQSLQFVSLLSSRCLS